MPRRSLHFSPHPRSSRERAFTLVEVLVALLVAAIVAVLSFRGIDALITAESRLDEHAARWLAVHRFFNSLETDLRLAMPRPGRDAGGTPQPALLGQAAAVPPFDAQLALIQTSAAVDPPVRRIGYRFRDERIELLRWPAADLSPYGEPQVSVALDGVRDFSVRYLGSTGVWTEDWRPNDPAELPRGFGIRVDMLDPAFGGPIERVVSR